jgi:hypothetical protein
VFAFSSGTAAAVEGGFDSSLSLTIVREQGMAGEVEVTWTMALGSASADDVREMMGTVLFADGQSAGSLEIGLVDDVVPELDETFAVALSVCGARF